MVYCMSLSYISLPFSEIQQPTSLSKFELDSNWTVLISVTDMLLHATKYRIYLKFQSQTTPFGFGLLVSTFQAKGITWTRLKPKKLYLCNQRKITKIIIKKPNRVAKRFLLTLTQYLHKLQKSVNPSAYLKKHVALLPEPSTYLFFAKNKTYLRSFLEEFSKFCRTS